MILFCAITFGFFQCSFEFRRVIQVEPFVEYSCLSDVGLQGSVFLNLIPSDSVDTLTLPL